MKCLGMIYVKFDPAQEPAASLSKSEDRKLRLLLLHVAGGLGRGERREGVIGWELNPKPEKFGKDFSVRGERN